MKKAILAPMLLCLLILLVPQQFSGQIQTTNTLKANIPFEFQVGAVILPAGTYFIKFDHAQQVATFTGLDVNANAIVFSNDIRSGGHDSGTQVVLKRSGNVLVLHRVLDANGQHSHDLVHPRGVADL